MVLARSLREVPTSLSNSSASLNSLENSSTNNTSMAAQVLPARAPNNMAGEQRTIYLGDLDMDSTEKQLQDYFYSLGVPVVKLAKQPHSSYAHVTLVSAEQARRLVDEAAISVYGRNVRVLPYNQPNNFDPNANLIIKNLEPHLGETDIINKMSRFGEILSCKLVRDERGESKCYSYLQYKEAASAAEAIDQLNNTYWDEKCDPDYKYRMFQQKLKHSQLLGKLNESDLQESMLFADFTNKMGKKIYVGLFKKKDEYNKIKTDKEGKPSNLYVKNFGTNFGDRDLFNLFKTYGSIKSAKVRRMKTGLVEKPLGCGFVDFENPEEAERARLALDNHPLACGRVISVTYADCKSRRMRKKLEESETKQQQRVVDTPVADMELVAATPSPPPVFSPSIYEISAENHHGNQANVPSNGGFIRIRIASNSSESSYEMGPSTTCSPRLSREFSDDTTWSKLLGTNQWHHYKLFDDGINLLN